MPPKKKGTRKKPEKVRTPTLIRGLTEEEKSREQILRKHFPGFGVLGPHPPSTPPKLKPPALSPWCKLPPIRKCFVNEQMGIYSNIITTFKFQSRLVVPEVQHRSQGQSILGFSDRNTRKVTTFKTPSDQCKLVEKDNHGPTSQQAHTSYFKRGGDKPKVQIPYQTIPGQIPRKLVLERLRREYLKLDFERLLAEKGIYSHLVMPRHPSRSDENVTSPENPVSPYRPLEIFDNEEYECRSPEDWLALGNAEGSPDQRPVPAKALLPKDDMIPSKDLNSSSLEYSWHLVGVLDFCKEKLQYLVQKVHQNTKLTDEEGNPIPNGQEVNTMTAGTEYWIPRIRLLFSAEDPRVFVERIQFALHSRENTEALCLYHLSVACMPIWRGTPSLDVHSLQRIKSCALSAPGLRSEIVEKCIGELENEVKLEYDHTMNCMTFDKVVMSHPEEFSHITLPQKDPEYVHACVPVPAFAYKKNKTAFVFQSLLTKPEVIRVLTEIRSECNKVATMRLFSLTLITPVPLGEFEVRQSERRAQISLFLREAWMVPLSNSIRYILGNIGKGWYNVNEFRWDMYKMSKLYRLMAVVRFQMQDSLRFLVQDSLISLTQLVLDTCHSVLTCPQDLVWGNDLITSPYKPKKNPLFLVNLVLDQTKVHYSTPLENFETSVIDLFDEGILATYKVPQLEKFVMQKLFIGDEPFLNSVNLRELEVTELREKIRNALIQAAIPLRAYAAEYKRHLELHNLGIEKLLKSHMHGEKTYQEVKKKVEQHLKEMERLEHSLPSSIVIGPFTVCVEAVRQALSDKRDALASALLDLF